MLPRRLARARTLLPVLLWGTGSVRIKQTDR
jgi:hypothetical protein